MTAIGAELLSCPSCGEDCKAVPPMGGWRSREEPYPWWEDGQRGTCACGTEVEVCVDEDGDGYNVARLEEADSE